MKRMTGREMRKLTFAITLMTLVLVIGVIAYFMIDVILTTNDNIEENKQLVVEKSVVSLQETGDRISSLSSSPQLLEIFDQEMVEGILNGDMGLLYNMAASVAVGLNPLEYAGVVVDGELVTYRVAPGVEADVGEMSARQPTEEYALLDNFGGEEGVYVSLFYPIDLATLGISEQLYMNMIVDRTAELQEIDDYFVSQRNDLIVRMSIVSGVAILLIVLITTFGLRHFTNKYVMEPLEGMNRMAEEIADGTFRGDVQVDKGSAYATLQGLLRSGQLILRQMDREMQ